MRWLIVEDALQDSRGHWLEYIGAFHRGLRALGDDVTVLVPQQAEPTVAKTLDVRPILPDSIWHRMGDGAGALKRYARVPAHAWQTWRYLLRFLRNDSGWDVIFIPTTLVHHLLGWYALLRTALCGSRARLLLFFPNLPIRLHTDGTPAWIPSPTTRLLSFFLRRLGPDIAAGRVVLGVETREMRVALAALTNVPVTYLPHPVTPLPGEPTAVSGSPALLLAGYGAARAEKGSDFLQAAIVRHVQRCPEGASRFCFQWIGEIVNERGERVGLNAGLKGNPRVEIIERYFAEGEYERRLRETNVMLLPYRRSSYDLRVSRVVIEALVNGIPVAATHGTTLLSQADEFGAAIACLDGSVESLDDSIETAVRLYPELRARALSRMPAARDHFSVKNFRELLLTAPGS